MAKQQQATASGGEAASGVPIESVQIADDEFWTDGPPYELFKRMRERVPDPLEPGDQQYPRRGGLLVGDARPTTSTRSAATGRPTRPAQGITALTHSVLPLELQQAMFIGMDPPKHDRLKALFQRGFTPKRIADHEDAIRAITVDVLDGLGDRETCDLVSDVAQPVVSRVIHSFMGIPPEDDADWARLMNSVLAAGDPDLNPDGAAGDHGAATSRRSSSAAAS